MIDLNHDAYDSPEGTYNGPPLGRNEKLKTMDQIMDYVMSHKTDNTIKITFSICKADARYIEEQVAKGEFVSKTDMVRHAIRIARYKVERGESIL